MTQFQFVQFEFTSSLGPPPGRYTVVPRDDHGTGIRAGAAARNGASARADAAADAVTAAVRNDDGDAAASPEQALGARSLGAADVVVFAVHGAPAPAMRRVRTLRASDGDGDGSGAAALSVTLVTVILATRMIATDLEAQRRHARLRGSESDQQELITAALAIARRCVGAYRVAAADPYVADISPLDARAIRIGYGPGATVLRGGWSEALGVRPPKAPKVTRTGRLMPVQAMAAILSGQGRALEAEDMVLTVLRDLDHGRVRAAAVTLLGAIDLLLAELEGQELPGSVLELLGRLEDSRERAEALAQRALAGQLRAGARDQSPGRDSLAEIAEQAGALIDAWRYVPLGFG